MVALLASACAACGRPRAREGADAPLELSIQNDIDTFDPRFASDVFSLRASRLVHAGLTRLDPDTLEPRPYLARAWRWLDPLTLRVELRDDVRFHSGAPFTPADVIKTLEAFQSPEVGSRHLRVVEAIARAVPDGPHAVVLTLARPHATVLTDLEVPILRADQAFAAPDTTGALDGLGPFRVARATRGDVLLEPCSGGPLPRPAHAVVLRTVHDDNARALRLLAGKSDVALNVFAVASALEGRDGLAVADRPGANLTYAVTRVDRGPLADVRIRRAVSMAIDRAGLAATLFEGRAQAASTLVPREHWAHANLPEIPFDPAAARALVAEALGSPSARVHTTLLTSTDRFRITIGRAVAQELADANVDAEVIPLELGTLLARLNAGDFEAAILSFPEFTEPNVLRNLLRSSFVPPVGYNRAHVQDAVLDALLDAGDESRSVEERKEIYAQVEARAREGVYLIPLWNEDQVVLTSLRARSFALSAEGRWLGLAAIP
ncbi:MAG TPA: ABC transporter substrate-binding protein [Polyangiaceae bacterium]|jgi:peptide/nickel transport system substrate-binding protein